MFGGMQSLDKEEGAFNAVYIMADSGARAASSRSQLAGMRASWRSLGEIIETPITVELPRGPHGPAVLISTHGARKGGRHALKTADSGYLTRRLVDVAQDVIIHESDCGTLDASRRQAIIEGARPSSVRDRIIGASPSSASPIPSRTRPSPRRTGNHRGTRAAIQDAGIERVKIRSC